MAENRIVLEDNIQMLTYEGEALKQSQSKNKMKGHEMASQLKMIEAKLNAIEAMRHQLNIQVSSETDEIKIVELKCQIRFMETQSDAIKAMSDDRRCNVEEDAVMAETVNEKIQEVDAKIKIEQSKLDDILASLY